jgi:hypothetical protein
LGSPFLLWRAKPQKWCSSGPPQFLNATVALHKGRATVALYLIILSFLSQSCRHHFLFPISLSSSSSFSAHSYQYRTAKSQPILTKSHRKITNHTTQIAPQNLSPFSSNRTAKSQITQLKSHGKSSNCTPPSPPLHLRQDHG